MTNLIQLRLELPELKDGVFTPIPVQDDDIGGQLLPILSKGLYTYPLHSIREYVQNAVDAHATEVTIKFTSSSITIFDDGQGMSYRDIVDARRFGVSLKNPEFAVGFRGIGIYSSFDLCNRLLITTKKADETKAYVLEFNFGEMKKQLERDSRSEGSKSTSLSNLLYTNSKVTQEQGQKGRHYTMVTLEDISADHISQLSDPEKLRKYILKNLPVDFAEDFAYKNEITRQLQDNIKGYNAVKINLEFESKQREVICRPNIPDLKTPRIEFVRNHKGEPIALFWASLYQGRGKIPEEYADFRGFVYKIKGFTIGDNRRLQPTFKKGGGGLYWWYTGEVYVLDPNVLPNTERDDFETNPAKDQLEEAIAKVFKHLDNQAYTFQEQSRAEQKFTQAKTQLSELSEQVTNWLERQSANASDTVDESFAFTVFHKIEDTIREVKTQRGKAKDKGVATALIQQAEDLKRMLRRRELTGPQSATSSQKPTPKKPVTESSDTVTPNNATTAQVDRTLVQVVEDIGWEVTDDSSRLLHIIDTSLADVLGSNSAVYRNLLNDIEAKLAWHSSGR